MKQPLIALLLTATSLAHIAWAQATGDAQRGEQLWQQTFTVAGETRSCTTCHTTDPRAAGKHKRTGKPIEPMTPSANSKRFTNSKKTAKWFKRNCKWTLGRVCTEQEQADIIAYMKSL